MKHTSSYLEWYVRTPELRHDFRSSGIGRFPFNLNLGEVDLSTNFWHGNPDVSKSLARLYGVALENVFVSSEGTSGQNARIVRVLAEKSGTKNEAVVEYPTYEPLLRQVQEHFCSVKRLERKQEDSYRLDVDTLRKVVTRKTGLVVLTNPHTPSGAICTSKDLREIMTVAHERGFYVLCDEIYAEFDRSAVPTLFSVDGNRGIVTSSFTKAYGLGGIKLGVALAEKKLVDELYTDVLNTVGNSPNIVQIIASEILTKGKEELEAHKQKWMRLKKATEEWLKEKSIGYFPSEAGLTYWIEMPLKDTYKWVNEKAVPHFNLALVPGAFFLFKSDYKIVESKMARLGLGNINPQTADLVDGLQTLEKAMKA